MFQAHSIKVELKAPLAVLTIENFEKELHMCMTMLFLITFPEDVRALFSYFTVTPTLKIIKKKENVKSPVQTQKIYASSKLDCMCEVIIAHKKPYLSVVEDDFYWADNRQTSFPVSVVCL